MLICYNYVQFLIYRRHCLIILTLRVSVDVIGHIKPLHALASLH